MLVLLLLLNLAHATNPTYSQLAYTCSVQDGRVPYEHLGVLEVWAYPSDGLTRELRFTPENRGVNATPFTVLGSVSLDGLALNPPRLNRAHTQLPLPAAAGCTALNTQPSQCAQITWNESGAQMEFWQHSESWIRGQRTFPIQLANCQQDPAFEVARTQAAAMPVNPLPAAVAPVPAAETPEQAALRRREELMRQRSRREQQHQQGTAQVPQQQG